MAIVSKTMGSEQQQPASTAAGLQAALLIIGWYTSNIMLLLVNKWLMSATSFRQPIFLTFCHMAFCTLVSYLLAALGVFPSKQLSPTLVAKVALLAVTFCLSIMASMASYAFIPASFAQALGSTTPVFTAALTFLVQGRREAGITYGALGPVVVGIAIASGGEPLFSMVGTLLQLSSAAARALKSVMQALLLQDDSERFHPMSLLQYTSAASVVLLVPLLLVVEPGALQEVRKANASNPIFVPLLLASCATAALVNLTNFLVTKGLGALTLQVLGNAKNVVAAGVSVAVFHNPVTAQGLGGYGVTVAGVYWYSHCVKTHKAQVGAAPLGLLWAAVRRRLPLPLGSPGAPAAAAAAAGPTAAGAGDGPVSLGGAADGVDAEQRRPLLPR